jgi:hypothetical protein
VILSDSPDSDISKKTLMQKHHKEASNNSRNNVLLSLVVAAVLVVCCLMMCMICCFLICMKKVKDGRETVKGDDCPARKPHESEEAPLLPSHADMVETKVESPREPSLLDLPQDFPQQSALVDTKVESPREPNTHAVTKPSFEDTHDPVTSPQVVQLEPDTPPDDDAQAHTAATFAPQAPQLEARHVAATPPQRATVEEVPKKSTGCCVSCRSSGR